MNYQLGAATAFLQAVELLDREMEATKALSDRLEKRIAELELLAKGSTAINNPPTARFMVAGGYDEVLNRLNALELALKQAGGLWDKADNEGLSLKDITERLDLIEGRLDDLEGGLEDKTAADDIEGLVREFLNSNFTISFDC